MPLPEPLLKLWSSTTRAPVRLLEIREEGVVLGKTLLAPFRNDGLVVDAERIAAMLSVTYNENIPVSIAKHFRFAERYWKRGDKALAQMPLALTGCQAVNLEQAQRLFACEWGLNRGLSIHQLLKIAGFEKFNPYHLGPGPGGGQFTTAEMDGTSGGTQVAQNESSGIDGYDRNRPWDFPTPQVFLPVIPEGLIGESAAAAGARTVAQSESTIEELLMPGGNRIGQAGTSGDIRIIRGNVSDAQTLFRQLTAEGKVIANST